MAREFPRTEVITENLLYEQTHSDRLVLNQEKEVPSHRCGETPERESETFGRAFCSRDGELARWLARFWQDDFCGRAPSLSPRRALPMNSCGWRQDKSSAALLTCFPSMPNWSHNQRRRQSHASNFGQRPSPRSGDRKTPSTPCCFFFFASSRDFQFLVRSDCGRVAADCRRVGVGGVSVCRGGGPESNLGAGDS